MASYSITQISADEIRVQVHVQEDGNRFDIDPSEIGDNLPEIYLGNIDGKLKLDLSRKTIGIMKIFNCSIDLTDAYLPRRIEELMIYNSYLMGNFQSYMEVKYLHLVDIPFVQNIVAFKTFFKGVDLVDCGIQLHSMAAYIPLSARVIESRYRLNEEQASEILKRHPNCRAITLCSTSVERTKQFLERFKHQLFIDWQMDHRIWTTKHYYEKEELRRFVKSFEFLHKDKFHLQLVSRGRGEEGYVQEDDGKRKKVILPARTTPKDITSVISQYLGTLETKEPFPSRG